MPISLSTARSVEYGRQSAAEQSSDYYHYGHYYNEDDDDDDDIPGATGLSYDDCDLESCSDDEEEEENSEEDNEEESNSQDIATTLHTKLSIDEVV